MKDDQKVFALGDEQLEQVSGGGDSETYFVAEFICPDCGQTHEFRFEGALNPTPAEKNFCSKIASYGYIWPEAHIFNYTNVNGVDRQVSFTLLGAEWNGQFYPAP